MSQKPITEAVFRSICREASDRPLSSRVATLSADYSPLEDYLYTVWFRVAEYLGNCDDPKPREKVQSWTNERWLREEVFHLVAKPDAPVLSIDSVLNEYRPSV